LKAEEEGKEKKEFALEEVRDRIIALRATRDRRKPGELPPAKTLDSPKALDTPVSKSGEAGSRLMLGIFGKKFW
jgi:hypothetical protein